MKIGPVITLALCAFLFGLGADAKAQDFPVKPIRIFVPLTPGSGADIIGRIFAKQLSEMLGQRVTVENRPGAGGQIGGQMVLDADPDGHTLLVHSASYAINAAVFRSLPYDPLVNFVDVARLGVTPYVMITAKGGAYPTIKSLIAAAKARPGIIPFASAGVGSSTHFAAAQFAIAAGVKMLHVPYTGSPEAIGDAMTGKVSFYMAPLNTVRAEIGEGKLSVLGISTAR